MDERPVSSSPLQTRTMDDSPGSWQITTEPNTTSIRETIQNIRDRARSQTPPRDIE